MAPGRKSDLTQAREIAARLVDGHPLSRAADELGLSPQAVSRRVAAMRRALATGTGDAAWLDVRARPPAMVARAWLAREG